MCGAPCVMQACWQVGLVHRDLCWNNAACDIKRERWYLLDLKLCGQAGQRPISKLRSWDAETLVAGLYPAASDLYCLGRMLRQYSRLVVSDEGAEIPTGCV